MIDFRNIGHLFIVGLMRMCAMSIAAVMFLGRIIGTLVLLFTTLAMFVMQTASENGVRSRR